MTASLSFVFVRTSNTNGLARSSEELRADPNALANGAFDAPSKANKGRKAEAAPGGPSSSDVAVAGKHQAIYACTSGACVHLNHLVSKLVCYSLCYIGHRACPA